jgi:hypothetical protein
MAILTEEDRRHDVFFDASLLHPENISSNNLRRVVLLDKDVYDWFCETEAPWKSYFLSFLDSVQPEELRKQKDLQQVGFQRRAVIGIKNTYEVLCTPLKTGDNSRVVLFTPFVTSPVEGATDVGVLGTSYHSALTKCHVWTGTSLTYSAFHFL